MTTIQTIETRTKSLSTMTVATLRQTAIALELPAISRLRKDDLVRVVAIAEDARDQRQAGRTNESLSPITKEVGVLSSSIIDMGNGRYRAFLTQRAGGADNLYLLISHKTMTALRHKARTGEFNFASPVVVAGHSFASQGRDRHGNPLPNGFFAHNIRQG